MLTIRTPQPREAQGQRTAGAAHVLSPRALSPPIAALYGFWAKTDPFNYGREDVVLPIEASAVLSSHANEKVGSTPSWSRKN